MWVRGLKRYLRDRQPGNGSTSTSTFTTYLYVLTYLTYLTYFTYLTYTSTQDILVDWLYINFRTRFQLRSLSPKPYEYLGPRALCVL